MASSFISPPGSEFGPCAEFCDHRDCAASRRVAGASCGICGEPIGYDRHYYAADNPDNGIRWTHATCEEEEIERAMRA
jgi:hypothetical protein